MELYFLRHGRSVSRSDWADDDEQRPLTEEGKTAMAHEAATMVRLGLAPDAIVSSPLVRARQTAEITATGLSAPDRLAIDDLLAEGFNVKRLRKLLRTHKDAGRVMLVGHEPDFSDTIGQLTGGRVTLTKGGLARVDIADTQANVGELVWLLQARELIGEGLAPTAAINKAA